MKGLHVERDQGASSVSAAFSSYRAALRSFVARRISDPEAVDDLVQEAYARLMARTQEAPVEAPQAYLFKIASNLLIDRRRGDGRTRGEMLPLEDHMAETEPRQEEGRRYLDLRREFNTALDELPKQCRDIFILRRFDDLDSATIAARFKISQRMVQKHLARATAHLYVRLQQFREYGL